MIPALNAAHNGLVAASERVEARAMAIASASTATGANTAGGNASGGAGARIRYLPLPADAQGRDLADDMTSLVEDEMAFKANAAVVRIAVDMTRALYDALD